MRLGHDRVRLRDVWLIAAVGWAAAILVAGTLPTQGLVTALAPQREAATTAAGHLGWVVGASGQGFADRIELLIGLSARGDTITGLYVLEQKETPGLGSKITGDFQEQFARKDPAKGLEVTKDKPAEGANQIRAIAGATVSTRSVCDIVNAALKDLPGKLAAEAKE